MDCLVESNETAPNDLGERITPKKKIYYFQRDSLKKRNRLLVGKEGSRRRQRYDNGHFTFHPCAILYEEDLLPPGYQQSNEGLWSHPDIMTWLSEGDDDQDFGLYKDEHRTLALISHRVHKDLKKQHVPQGLVRHYENALVDFITKEDGYCAVDSMALEIDNPFTRFVIHTMCRFHQMESYSVQQNGKYLLHVTHPSCLDGGRRYPSLNRSFFDYLYSLDLD